MWKKAFFRLLLVIGIVAAGMLVAGANQKSEAANQECSGSEEKSCKNEQENSTLGDFNIWESLSRIVSVSI